MRSLLGLVLLSACYDPDTVDCTITCSAADECAEGQVCDSDGFCAAPEIAGRCVESVALEVHIDGDGKVSLDGIGECDSRTADDRTCTFSVHANQPRRLRAVPYDDRSFESWSSACSGETATCELTPVMELTRVGAKFD
jgi:hypothetical protein